MFQFSNLVEALDAAPGERALVTHWIDEDESETVTFAQFRERTRRQAQAPRAEGLSSGDQM